MHADTYVVCAMHVIYAMHVCDYACMSCMHAFVHVGIFACVHIMWACTCVRNACVSVSVRFSMRECVCCVYAWVHGPMCAFMFACMCACMYGGLLVCMHVCAMHVLHVGTHVRACRHACHVARYVVIYICSHACMHLNVYVVFAAYVMHCMHVMYVVHA